MGPINHARPEDELAQRFSNVNKHRGVLLKTQILILEDLGWEISISDQLPGAAGPRTSV